jgi:hypothetical protein
MISPRARAPHGRAAANPPQLADAIDFSILGPLAHDAQDAISHGLAAGVVFSAANPLDIFRHAVSTDRSGRSVATRCPLAVPHCRTWRRTRTRRLS